MTTDDLDKLKARALQLWKRNGCRLGPWTPRANAAVQAVRDALADLALDAAEEMKGSAERKAAWLAAALEASKEWHPRLMPYEPPDTPALAGRGTYETCHPGGPEFSNAPLRNAPPTYRRVLGTGRSQGEPGGRRA